MNFALRAKRASVKNESGNLIRIQKAKVIKIDPFAKQKSGFVTNEIKIQPSSSLFALYFFHHLPLFSHRQIADIFLALFSCNALISSADTGLFIQCLLNSSTLCYT